MTLKLQYEAIEMFLKCSYYLKDKFNFVFESMRRVYSNQIILITERYPTTLAPIRCTFPQVMNPPFALLRRVSVIWFHQVTHTQDEWFQRNTQNIAAQVDDRYFISTTCHVPAAHRSSCVMREEFAGASPKPIDII